MRQSKKIHSDQVKSPLQLLFVKRINDELRARGWSDNQFAQQCKAEGWDIGQSSVSRITGGRQDPTLEMLFKLAKVLKIPAWELLVESPSVGESLQPAGNVRHLPSYPPIIGQHGKSSGNKARDKRQRRA